VRGRAAIVAASTAVLAAGRIDFDPPLPLEIQEAIAALPLGEAEKVAVAFSRDVFGRSELDHLSFVHDTLEAVRFFIRPFGHDLAIAYIAGRFARALSDEGEAAMIAFAEDRLVDVFGADIRRHRIGAAATGWLRDPDIGGGYSCALPGKAAARAVLATPVGDRLFFAGEACSLRSYGTIHGAYESGVAAARAVAATLGPR
jgi:monoamine oxidase